MSGAEYRRAGRKGVGFSVMIAGEPCLGKSTLVDTLFGQPGHGEGRTDHEESLKPSQNENVAPHKGTDGGAGAVTARASDLVVDGVSIKLTILDTPGFGDSLDTRDDVTPLAEYIDAAFREYLQGESQADRSKLVDRRVHCLLYLFRGSASGLSPLDLQALTHLYTKVNIIPVMAKADTFTLAEREQCKAVVRQQLEAEGIKVFNPKSDPEDVAAVRAECEALAQAMPFAVIGSVETHDVGGVQRRGRRYGWGVAEVDNAAHCDSAMLQKMLTETHLHDLKGVTEVHYEMFRKKVLEKSGIGPDASPTFTSTRGRTAENELQKKHEDMKRDLEEQARSLEEKRRQFEEERKLYDEAKRRTSATSNSSATN